MMNFQGLQYACSLSKCRLTETETTLILEFPQAKIEVAKDFSTGPTQAALFLTSGWLPTFRQYLDNQDRKEDVAL